MFKAVKHDNNAEENENHVDQSKKSGSMRFRRNPQLLCAARIISHNAPFCVSFLTLFHFMVKPGQIDQHHYEEIRKVKSFRWYRERKKECYRKESL